MERRHGFWLAGAAGLALGALLAGGGRDVQAQQRGPAALPASCDEGDLVVADGRGRFACRGPERALQLAGCRDGDFVVMTGGALRCERPSSTSWGVRNLLPDCSSGAMLVSEGFGRWRCTEHVLPRCSSGEILVSQGSGEWRCASPERR